MTNITKADPSTFQKISWLFAARKGFASNLITVLGGQIACALIALAVEILYARLLGPEGRGQISLCLMAIAFGVLLGGLGGEIPMVIWTADANRRSAGRIFAILFWGLLGSVISSSLWIYINSTWHPEFLKGVTPLLAILVLATIPVNIFLGYLMAALTGLERFGTRVGLALVDQVVGLLVFVILIVMFGRKTEFALLGSLSGSLIGAGVAAALLLKGFLGNFRELRLAREDLSSALSLGLRGQLGNIATFFNYRLDVFIVNYFLDPAQLGIYAVGVVVSEALWQIPNAAALALFPRTARTIDQGAAEFTCRVVRQVFVIACVSGLALGLVAPIAIPLVFGARFAPSIPVIFWILPGTVALSLAKVISADLAARGKPQYSSIFAVVSLVATLALDLILIPRMGIQGAALASSSAYFLQSVLLAVTLKYQLKTSWRSLLIPSQMELTPYRQIWSRFKERSGMAGAAAGIND